MDSVDVMRKAMEILMPHIRVHTYTEPNYDDIVEGMIEERNIAKHERS